MMRSNSLKILSTSTRKTPVTSKSFNIKYEKFQSISQTNFDSWIKHSDDLKSMSMSNMNENFHVISASEDEDAREMISNGKIFINQASQVHNEELKPLEKKKKKHRTSPRKTKQINATPIPSAQNITTDIPTIKKVTIEEPTNPNTTVKRLITVDTSKARSNLEVVRLCLRELAWKEVNAVSIDSDIYWHSSSFHEGNPTFPYNSGRVNKFPGMNEILRKVHLTRLLNNMRLLFPNDYNFYPRTWFLPEQIQQFKDDLRHIQQKNEKNKRSLTTFIAKPSDGSQGEGIYLLQSSTELRSTNRPYVIQEYIAQPLLINGLKFDLRIYVLILNLNPLEIYLYDEGLVRFATINYKTPTNENINQTYMHLTNYSLNKRSVHYKHTTDESQTDGSKRKLSLVWKQLSEMFGNERIERTKILIKDLINKTILAVVPQLKVEHEIELPRGKKPDLSCFQIVGFDVILTEQLKPILLEVNSNPSLRIDFDKMSETGKLVYQSSLIDEEIKKPLILETLKLALPKKKLNTIARHAQIQADDEFMSQRFEKVAQRRVEQRTEKLKDIRKSRFDMRLNPFLSRPLESIAKEFVRQQQQQSATHRPNEPITPYTQFHNHSPIRNTSKHNDAGRRSCMKSTLARPISTMTDATSIRTVERLKLIYPTNQKSIYQQFVLIDQIAYIYIQLVVSLGNKTMTGGQFRNFANICGIINETITAPSIDILYFQILKKWQTFVLRTTLTGLPFAAFIEAFFLLSQRKYPHVSHLIDSVTHLLDICQRHLNLSSETFTYPSIVQTPNPYRSVKSSLQSSTLNLRSNNNSTIRSTTTASVYRSNLTVSSAPASNTEKPVRQSAKSVFPLFFNVL